MRDIQMVLERWGDRPLVDQQISVTRELPPDCRVFACQSPG
jgi:hypothetical protein